MSSRTVNGLDDAPVHLDASSARPQSENAVADSSAARRNPLRLRHVEVGADPM
jgi:hypothetical protein